MAFIRKRIPFHFSLIIFTSIASYILIRRANLCKQMRQRIENVESQRLNDANQYAQVTQLRAQFVRAATHDLKNPLNVVKGYIELLSTEPAITQNDSAMMFLRHMEHSANRMHALIIDMLDLLEVQSEVKPTLRRVNLNQLIEDTLIDYLPQAAEKGIVLEFQPAEPGIIASVDAHRFERLVDNVLSNAIKYTPQNGYVTVYLDKKLQQVHLCIADTGMGIPEADLPHIFESFYRVQEESHYEIDGTGLGLSIVNAIADQHNATIQVQSEVNKGTRFTIMLLESR